MYVLAGPPRTTHEIMSNAHALVVCTCAYKPHDYACTRVNTSGWVSITKGGCSDRNRDVIEPIEIETFTQTRRQVQAAGPAWALGPEDRSNIETEIPNHVGIESIEPRPTLYVHRLDP